ncbi:hypothetical protein JG688_00013662 [Phytophthora aleatoria]|uniref:Uncharacterized protein n=1 Tax=Phytophthora aleatoria TaxID=2496075 RepID=A0A8J5IIL6_9STRA|nr:hypothetical protein JG688_00013662 [Phytophthora aleatoria]
MNPDYFQQLVNITRVLNDSRLEDVALEAHFHALIRQQKSFRFTFRKYALTHLKDKEEKGTITCGRLIHSDQRKLLQIMRNSKTLEECVATMESWATTLPRRITGSPQCKFSYDTPNVEARVERLCILNLTRATTHKFDQDILWRLAQLIVRKQLPV